MSATTRAQVAIACAARGLAPIRMKRRFSSAQNSPSGCVASTSRTIQSWTSGAIGMRRASFCAATIVRASSTCDGIASSVFVVRSSTSRKVSRSGGGTSILRRNRSSCASGSGKVPSCSIGFCVAITKNGRPSERVSPPEVTERSCIASRSADCVFGLARLTSSASTSCAKSGPGRKRISRRPVASFSIRIEVPVMSAGITSGVNWMRLKPRPVAAASDRTSSVLPRPGTPSRSR